MHEYYPYDNINYVNYVMLGIFRVVKRNDKFQNSNRTFIQVISQRTSIYRRNSN